jgi:hypothetical protein
MNKETFVNLLKYLVLVIVVYSVLKYLPNTNLCENDLIFSTVIIVLFYILIEQLMNKNKSPENFTGCSNVCNRVENMEDVHKTDKPHEVEHKRVHEVEHKRVHDVHHKPAHEVEHKRVHEVEHKRVHEVEHNEPENKEEEKHEYKEEVHHEQEEDLKGNEKIMAVKQMLDNLKSNIDNLHQTISNTNHQDLKDVKKHLAEKDKKAGIERSGSRDEDGVIYNELGYTDYNHLPLADTYDNDSFEYGYSFLPPEKWYPQPPFPPMCVTDKKCPVMPVFTTGTPMDVKEWNESRRVTPPDNIKTKYIKEKLNSGK